MRSSLVKLHFALAFLFALAVPAAAQTHAFPGSDKQAPVKCTGCKGQNIHFQNNDGLNTYPFSAPIVKHVGRLLDSSSTQNYQAPGFRTGRAGKIMTARTTRGTAPPRAYIRIGEAIFAWSLNSFFTQALPGGMKAVNTFAPGVSGRVPALPPYEQLLIPDAFCYPEYKTSDWSPTAGDVQNTFGDMDYDDRGFVYAGMKDHGWGVVRDSGETGMTHWDLVSPQMPGTPFIPQVLVSLKAGSKYYVAISDANALGVGIFDVTNATNPTLVGAQRNGSQWGMRWWTKSWDGNYVAYVGGDHKLYVHDVSTYIAGGTALKVLTPTSGRQFRDITFDENGNLWLAEGHEQAPMSNVLRRLTPSGGGFVEDTPLNVYGENFSPQKIHASDGYIVFSGWGIGSDGSGALDVKIFKVEGSGLREIGVNKFFSKYYHRAPLGYAQPPVYPATYLASPALGDIHIIKWNGKLYLIYSAWGIGDVYELESGGSIIASMKSNGFGTANPNSKGTAGPFPGDIVTFNGSSTVPNSTGLVWDFGNPESGTGANVGGSSNGADISHQYTGYSTAAQINAPKKVKIYDGSDDEITNELTLTLNVPVGRVGVGDSTITAATTGAALVFGENLTDASDGSVEGHFVNWTLDGVPVKLHPNTPLASGAIGQHTLTHSATYGKYDLTNFLPFGSSYVTAPISVTYDVRPFLFAFKTPTKNANNVTFGATGRKTSDPQVMSATQWTVAWSLTKNAVDLVPPQVSTVNINANLPSFVVPTTSIQDDSVLTLTLSVATAGLSQAAQPYASFTQTMILDAPDPKINKTVAGNCKALVPCAYTASSVGGSSMADWTLNWALMSGATVVTTGTGTSFSPTINNQGSYVVKLTATKSIFTNEAQANLTVDPPECAPPASKDFIGIYSSCTNNCTANADITFRPDLYGYIPQPCDQWLWDFGDGSTATKLADDFIIKHKFASNGTYTVKLTTKNATGQTVSDPITVRVGSSGGGGNPNPNPGTCTAPTAASFTYTGSKGCRAGVDCKVGESIVFTPKKNGGNLQTCDSASWNFGDGVESSSKGPSHTFTETGPYNVVLTISNTGGTAPQAVQVIRVVPDTVACTIAPTDTDFYIFFSGRDSGCTYSNTKLCEPGEVIEFKAFSFGYAFQSCDKFEWKFGDGTTSTAKEVEHRYPTNGFAFEVSLRVYNTNGGATLTDEITFEGAPQEPNPTLTGDFPTTGAKGSTITFTANSDIATTTGWRWNFGDGTGNDLSQAGHVGSSSTITHTFATPGAYTVTVEARNQKAASSALTAAATGRITVSDVTVYTFLLPAVIHDDGQNGSKWRTDVQVYYGAPNPAADPLVMDASINGQHKTLSINKATFIYEDFMASLVDGKAQGPVIITTQAKYKPQLWTRTYNVDPSGKTYGQFIPAIELTGGTGGAVDGLADPSRYYLSGLRQDGRYRTNIGLINTTTGDVIADITAYDDLNVPLDHFTETLTPFSLKQFSLGRVANLSNRPVSLVITVPAGKRMVGYASYIDGRSNDPVYISAVSDAELANTAYGTSITPGVGHIGDWRSDVTIFNPDDRNEVAFDLEYYDGSGLRRGLATGLKLGPLQSRNYEDLLKVQGLFNNVPDGVGMLKLVTMSQQTRYPLTFSRTYNDKGSGGTFGQGIPGVAASLANVKPGKAAIIAGVRSNANYKTNIGLTNVTANAVNVRVELLDPNTGAVARQEAYSLAGYSSVVGEYLFGGLSTGALKVEITGGDGAVWAFASVIDRNSNDPEYVPASPVQ